MNSSRSSHYLENLHDPRHIALIGFSEDRTKAGAHFLDALRRQGHAGEISLLGRSSGRVRVITIQNGSKRNAVSRAMEPELLAAFEGAENDPSVRAIVMVGAGDVAFCSGHDLAAHRDVHRRDVARSCLKGDRNGILIRLGDANCLATRGLSRPGWAQIGTAAMRF